MKREIKAVIQNTVEHLCEPQKAGLIPRPFRQPLSPAFYPDTLPIPSPDATENFKGVIVIKPDLNNFISYSYTNPIVTSITNAQFDSLAPHAPDSGYLDPSAGYYSARFYVRDANGDVKDASLVKLPPQYSTWFAQTTDGRWLAGYCWVVNGFIAAPSTNATLTSATFSTDAGVDYSGPLFRIGRFASGYASFSTSASVTLNEGVQSYALPDFPSDSVAKPLFMCIQLTQSYSGRYNFGYSVLHLDVSLTEQSSGTLAIKSMNDSIFAGILKEATQYSIPRFSALLEWTGSHQYDAGNISAALVPYGTQINMDDPEGTMAHLNALPYRNYKGRASKGAHVCYVPARTQDVFLRPLNEPINGNFIVFAWNCPPSGDAGQAPSFSLHWKPAPEWLADTSSLSQSLPPWDRDFVDTVFSFMAEHNPSGENPNHIDKIKAIAKSISNNPVVQEAARVAWGAMKASAKVAIPALIGMA